MKAEGSIDLAREESEWVLEGDWDEGSGVWYVEEWIPWCRRWTSFLDGVSL